MTLRVTTLAAAVALGVAGASVAYATIPDGGGVIHGCYAKTSSNQPPGSLRVIDTSIGQACAQNESPLAWSQTGPQGPPGPPGPSGISGYEVFAHFDSTQGPGAAVQVQATCPVGKVVIGGGVQNAEWIDVNQISRKADIQEEYPARSAQNGPFDQWIVSLGRLDGSLLGASDHVDGTVYAICVNPPS